MLLFVLALSTQNPSGFITSPNVSKMSKQAKADKCMQTLKSDTDLLSLL